ncbi:amidase-like [Pecten maximus]|uniref:amidase-like n=1 Tax=Pecten maximus TaxID=6579 RepID=UPI001458BDBE|nr:amidase-like [Pecten maximus]
MADHRQSPELLKSPAVLLPSKSELTKISEDLRLKCTEEEINAFHEHFKGTMKTYQRVNEIPEPQLPVKYPRTPGHREAKDSAWYWRCDIKGADTGKLVGKTVGVKDNVAVAGVPMMDGNKQLEGYTPEFDATIVTRILDAGGRILGKTACEDLSLSGNSWTPSTGPIPNPHCSTRSAGGSSGGSASLVARGEIDMAIGGDQGGSIRIPSSWSGTVGHKPTFGLVPYTGAVPIEMTVDHLGPITRTVADCALLLEVLAGYDNGTDPRQHPCIEVPPYSSLLTQGVAGKRVGLVTEGFEGIDKGVCTCVREAAHLLQEAGVVVEEVSIPLHADGLDIWTPVCFEGAYNMMIKGNGNGQNWKGHYCLSMQEALARGYNLRPHDFSMPCKLLAVFSEYMARNYQNKFYAKAQNLTRLLTQAYDHALRTYDVLIMPTLPSTAMALPTTETSISEILHLTFAMIKNTAPFDSTGHPALTINAGLLEGLPVGMMLVGRHFDDLTVLQMAHAFEKIRDKSLSLYLDFLCIYMYICTIKFNL